MAYSEKLAARVREALSRLSRVSEKKMFGGIAFMLNAKMCATVGADRIMVRVDPAAHDAFAKKKGARPVMMGGRVYRGYLHVDEKALATKRDLDTWLAPAIAFNKRAKKSTKR
jgi:TfoX/Sxy family transcriptional regulator of competence genes